MTDILPAHSDVELLSAEPVWQGRFPLHLIRFRHRRFDGTMSGERRWELWRRGRAASVLPYDPVADAVVMIEQFRLPALAAGLDPVMMEFPAGLLDPGEAPEATVRREMLEEAGIELERLEPALRILLTPGGCDEHCTLFVGEVRLGPVPEPRVLGAGGLAAEHEDIRVHALPATLAIERALAGEYENSVSLLGLLWLAAKRGDLRGRWTPAP
jgi:ADP-ribose pyrophosphatase